MKNDYGKLQEQEAPLKNGDNAFVQVGHDGEPVFPKVERENEDASAQEKKSNASQNK